ncbi:MAG: peptidoglycan/xylan/chitin deacetylase (PgdA/CDA1 family) [bacterium]|jgi:peptidoglycan/xylan/chitin deacetylase (PgdA/CDA1 family)
MIGILNKAKGLLKLIIYNILNTTGLYRVFVRKFGYPKILMYHRVCNINGISSISKDEFEKQIIFIKKNFTILPIDKLLVLENTCDIYKKAISITFDDGYEDFYDVAWPIIKKHSIPVTLYITTDFSANKCWLWPDKIKSLLENSQESQINIEPFGNVELSYVNILNNWHMFGDYCLELNTIKRDIFLATLEEALSVKLPKTPPIPFRAVNFEQLKEMSKDGLDIGSHTVTHPVLSKLEDSVLKFELEKSKKLLETTLNKRIQGICYPNGMPADINNNVIKYAKECGYKYGLMACEEKKLYSDRYRVGRISSREKTEVLAFKLL